MLPGFIGNPRPDLQVKRGNSMSIGLRRLAWPVGFVLICLTAPSGITWGGDGSESGGGGDYLKEGLLDRVQFGDEVNPRTDARYKGAYNKFIVPKLEIIRQSVPDLAVELETVFYKSWYQSSRPLKDFEIDPGTLLPVARINAEIPQSPGSSSTLTLDTSSGLENRPRKGASGLREKPPTLIPDDDLRRGLFQTENYVIVAQGLSKKSPRDIADGILHEAVRNLAVETGRTGRTVPNEEQIERLTMYVASLSSAASPKEIRQRVRELRFGQYLTAQEKTGFMQIFSKVVNFMCTRNADRFVSKFNFDKLSPEERSMLNTFDRVLSSHQPYIRTRNFHRNNSSNPSNWDYGTTVCNSLNADGTDFRDPNEELEDYWLLKAVKSAEQGINKINDAPCDKD